MGGCGSSFHPFYNCNPPPCDPPCCHSGFDWCNAATAALESGADGPARSIERRLSEEDEKRNAYGSLDNNIRRRYGYNGINIGDISIQEVNINRIEQDFKTILCGGITHVFNRTNITSALPTIKACILLVASTLGTSIINRSRIPSITMNHMEMLYGYHPTNINFPQHNTNSELPQNLNLHTLSTSIFYCYGDIKYDDDMGCVHYVDSKRPVEFSNFSTEIQLRNITTYFHNVEEIAKDNSEACSELESSYQLQGCCG